MQGLLRGLRVVEASSFAAVAQGGRQLAAWGADVIRIEPLAGAGLRVDPALNAGKRSVAIDIRRPQGLALAAQLVAAPGAQAGAWCTDWPLRGALSAPALAAARHDLVTVHLPDSGAAHATVAGQAVCGALLAALFDRERRGQGRTVTLMPDDLGDAPPRDAGFAHGFATLDGETVVLDGLEDARWYGLLQATGLAGAASALAARLELNLADEGHRLQAAPALAALFRPWFAARTRAEVAAAFERHRLVSPAVSKNGTLGLHTDEVLAEVLGLSPSQIGRLHDAGIVAAPAATCTACR